MMNPRLLMRVVRSSARSSSSYRGGPTRSDTSFGKARAQMSGRRVGLGADPEVQKVVDTGLKGFRTLLQRQERFAARHLGPLTLFNLGGAIMFCVVVAKSDQIGGGSKESEAAVVQRDDVRDEGVLDGSKLLDGGALVDGVKRDGIDSDSVREGLLSTGGYDMSNLKKGLAIALALGTSAFVAVTAGRLARSRVVEVRLVAGERVQLMTRTLLGFPTLAVRHEVPSKDFGIDFQKLRRIGLLRNSAYGSGSGKKMSDEPPLQLVVRTSDGRKNYSIDADEIHLIDTHRMETVASDAKTM